MGSLLDTLKLGSYYIVYVLSLPEAVNLSMDINIMKCWNICRRYIMNLALL